MGADHASIPALTNTCCAGLKTKCLKLQESRNALRQAVKVLEDKINEVEDQNAKLKKAYHEEQVRAKMEEEEKLKEFNARVSLENEVRGLKCEIVALRKSCGSSTQDENEDIKSYQACISDREEEINRLKSLLGRERIRADSETKNAEKETKKAAEAWKLLEAEKNKNVEKEMQIAKIEAEKAGELRRNAEKLASEMKKFKEAAKRFEAQKKKLIAEKHNAVSDLAKSQERLEVEKRKAAREKRRADEEMVKVEGQKKLAEDNLKRAMEEKQIANQMSQKLEECERTNEDLKQKISELSSLRKTIEMSAVSPDICVNAESTRVELLENSLKLQKLRTKHAKEKVKLEANRHRILQHELGRLKLDFFQIFHRLDMLDASILPTCGSKDDLEKPGNILNLQKLNMTRHICSSDKTCCTTLNACDPLKKNMHHISPLGLFGGNCAESITGIDYQLEPLDSNRTKLKNSAVNSSTSFSDGQLMGSQDKGALPVTASAKLAQENINTRPNMSKPSAKAVTEHSRKRKRILETVESIKKYCSEGREFDLQVEKELSDLHALLYKKVDKSHERIEMAANTKDKLLQKSDRPHKKRKKSHRAEVELVHGYNKVGEKGIEEAKGEVCEDTNICGHTCCPISYAKGATQLFMERTCDAASDFPSMANFEVADGNYMKLLDLENAADEECYRRAMDVPLSPSLPEIEIHGVETCDKNNLKPFLEEALRENMFSPRGDLFPSHCFDVIDVEISSNEEKFDRSRASYNSQQEPARVRETEDAKRSRNYALENSRTTHLLEGGIELIQNQLPKLCMVCPNIEDERSISRIFGATKNCMARCNLITKTGWIADSILTALTMEEKLLPREKISVFFTLLLFNFTTSTSIKFGKLLGGSLLPCLNSYAEHICAVFSVATTRLLFSEHVSLRELLFLIEDFLVEGKVMVNDKVSAETLSEQDLRTSLYLEAASGEQLVAGSIILASVCAATDHVEFIRESTYNILRFCRWDSVMMLTILHVFAYLGGQKFFCHNLMFTVLKSLIMRLEGGNLPVFTACCLPSVNQLHTELWMGVKCPFLEGAESIEIVALLLLENIRNCLLQEVRLDDSANSGSLSDKYNTAQWFNQEAAQSVIDLQCDAACCLRKCMVSATQPLVLNNASICHLSDVLSLVELVASRMSWHWTDTKLVPQLLNMLDSCVVENFSVAVVGLLGQLGRLGVVAGGYEDRGVENLRCYLFSYLCRHSPIKAGPSLLLATASALIAFFLLM
ncbi:uncharacterized protein LOC114718290 isoform X2 [Neltuma alba]|uniref:uncharacterized protein LOC114718290 isoform X2 n=1 Tax=Neltuma alba TaxID=207710 RepID=UPI0010A4B25C|nr:uncharacterized protein LOC114718290 isoform X2 [Prosopis alba]